MKPKTLEGGKCPFDRLETLREARERDTALNDLGQRQICISLEDNFLEFLSDSSLQVLPASLGAQSHLEDYTVSREVYNTMNFLWGKWEDVTLRGSREWQMPFEGITIRELQLKGGHSSIKVLFGLKKKMGERAIHGLWPSGGGPHWYSEVARVLAAEDDEGSSTPKDEEPFPSRVVLEVKSGRLDIQYELVPMSPRDTEKLGIHGYTKPPNSRTFVFMRLHVTRS
ncbi:hypothetical protein B0T24DRAFT_691076 [Lasiosphaeria ovina]|uniref:Uncharacterized protein n=1 Tax=Lasiosphaeria ovina TaxID=92902 RepID=A0AAE0JT63_9PEZI|nr:hypothetical protein B0T24DRAFT_691076 [Lasiosphaeria ovina]